jgi:hypothetical protein
MKLSAAILAASLGLAFAHGEHGQHMPKLVGARKFLSGFAARRRETSGDHGAVKRQHLPTSQRGNIAERQDDDGQCGPGIGSCASGLCCSAEGCVAHCSLGVRQGKLTQVTDGVERAKRIALPLIAK